MADQTVVYEFEIKLCNLEDKYWRRIEITSVSTVAKLAYAIMASFELILILSFITIMLFNHAILN